MHKSPALLGSRDFEYCVVEERAISIQRLILFACGDRLFITTAFGIRKGSLFIRPLCNPPCGTVPLYNYSMLMKRGPALLVDCVSLVL